MGYCYVIIMVPCGSNWLLVTFYGQLSVTRCICPHFL